MLRLYREKPKKTNPINENEKNQLKQLVLLHISMAKQVPQLNKNKILKTLLKEQKMRFFTMLLILISNVNMAFSHKGYDGWVDENEHSATKEDSNGFHVHDYYLNNDETEMFSLEGVIYKNQKHRDIKEWPHENCIPEHKHEAKPLNENGANENGGNSRQNPINENGANENGGGNRQNSISRCGEGWNPYNNTEMAYIYALEFKKPDRQGKYKLRSIKIKIREGTDISDWKLYLGTRYKETDRYIIDLKDEDKNEDEDGYMLELTNEKCSKEFEGFNKNHNTMQYYASISYPNFLFRLKTKENKKNRYSL